MLAVVTSGALMGVDAVPVQVECNTGEQGEPKPVIVGLPTGAVKEAKDRVWSALMNTGYRVPRTHTTINLAPSHLRKQGTLYDLPIALGLLAATGQLPPDVLEPYLIAGELSLSGETRPVMGGLALAALARQLGKKGVLVPSTTAEEAALVAELEVYAVRSLDEACNFLEGKITLPRVSPQSLDHGDTTQAGYNGVCFSEVKGQHAVRRAVEVSVAGGHNILMIGPPGSGKSMIAKRIPTIMPRLSSEEYLDLLRIYSAAGMTLQQGNLPRTRPFRSPHHTISDVGLIGGGSNPAPGEISLAHHGVLFLDELPEFKRSALEVMRQPLEDGQVSISRSAGKLTFPAAFMLVAAMNPTPDGFGKDRTKSTAEQIQRYRSRLSGPLLDRIDLHVEAPALSIAELQQARPGETSASIRSRVETARDRQRHRFASTPGLLVNARMAPRDLRVHCHLTDRDATLLRGAMERLQLSARAYDRILKVARTIADLAGCERIETPHLLEAIQYRSLDRGDVAG